MAAHDAMRKTVALRFTLHLSPQADAPRTHAMHPNPGKATRCASRARAARVLPVPLQQEKQEMK